MISQVLDGIEFLTALRHPHCNGNTSWVNSKEGKRMAENSKMAFSEPAKLIQRTKSGNYQYARYNVVLVLVSPLFLSISPSLITSHPPISHQLSTNKLHLFSIETASRMKMRELSNLDMKYQVVVWKKRETIWFSPAFLILFCHTISASVDHFQALLCFHLFF